MTNRYLEPSRILADGGAQVGKLPGSVPLHDLRDLGHPESPIKAIRAKCLDCSGGNDAEVRKCGHWLRALALPHGRQPVLREATVMTIERPMFPPVDPTRRKSAAPTFKIVARSDFDPPEPEQPKRKGG